MADRIKLPPMQIRTITQTEQQARTTIKLAFESVPILVVGMRGLQITDFEAYWCLQATAHLPGVPQRAVLSIILVTPSILATMATLADRIKRPTMETRTITQTEQQACTTE